MWDLTEIGLFLHEFQIFYVQDLRDTEDAREVQRV